MKSERVWTLKTSNNISAVNVLSFYLLADTLKMNLIEKRKFWVKLIETKSLQNCKQKKKTLIYFSEVSANHSLKTYKVFNNEIKSLLSFH